VRRAVVIGVNADALVAARLLSRSHEVSLVGETTEEESGWMPLRVSRAIGLGDVRIEPPDPWAAAALPGGGRLELWRDMRRSVESIRKVSAKDAASWPAFCGRMARLARFLESIYLEPPPDPLSVRFAMRARRLGREGLIDLMRLLPMPVAELLDDWFENDTLKGLLGAAGILHLQQGPRSGGTAFLFLHHHVGCAPGVFRPARSSLGELYAKAEARGSAQAIRVKEGKAVAVVLRDGEELPAELVVSGASPSHTLLELVDPAWIDPELARSLRHIRSRGVAVRVSLQLDRPPPFRRVVHAPSLDYLERAYDHSKYGRASQAPYLEATAGTENRVDVHVQYVAEGADIGALADVVVAILSEHLGDAQITAAPSVARLPAPQAELALDQALWMRPLPELAHYRTPIAGLWLCGPAMHPGPGIAGAAGYNCVTALRRAA
jgi:phytoene dehydrogenase-like protein